MDAAGRQVVMIDPTDYLPALTWVSNAVAALADVQHRFAGSLFTGFLTLGGLLFTANAVTSSKIQEFMRTPAYGARVDRMEELGIPFDRTQALLNRSIGLRRAAIGCLLVGVGQLVADATGSDAIRATALLFATGGVLAVCHYVNASTRAFDRWVRVFDGNEKARKAG